MKKNAPFCHKTLAKCIYYLNPPFIVFLNLKFEMKKKTHLFILIILVFPFLLNAQAEFFDKNWKPCTKTSASYFRKKINCGPVTNIDYVPTYKDGYLLDVKDTDLNECDVNDFYISGEPQFTCHAYFLKTDTQKKEPWYHGKAIWYFKDGEISQTALYQWGKPEGDIVEFDNQGNEIKRTKYVDGKEISDTKYAKDVYKWIVGDWKSEKITSDLSHLKTTKVTSLTYKNNGTLQISSTDKTEAKFGGMEPMYSGNTNTFLNWKYTFLNSNEGKIEFYSGGELVERGKIFWQGFDDYIYICTFAQQSQMVGNETHYYRQ